MGLNGLRIQGVPKYCGFLGQVVPALNGSTS